MRINSLPIPSIYVSVPLLRPRPEPPHGIVIIASHVGSLLYHAQGVC